MENGLPLLPWFLIILQILFYPAASQTKGPDLILDKDDLLTINTTTPYARFVPPNTSATPQNLNVTLKHGNASGPGGTKWPHSFAVLVVHGDIDIRERSRVDITGKHGLSIRSVAGNININATINMTCAISATGDDMCLGGYAPREKPYERFFGLVAGNGPGGVVNLTELTGLSYSPYDENFIRGAGHGGSGGGTAIIAGQYYGWSYEREDITNLVGGSTGSNKLLCSFAQHALSPGSGGGALDIQAEHGKITIASTITTSAQTVHGACEKYSGSSGGTIRLKAKKVILMSGSRLEVDGASAGTAVEGGLAGGAGGVVQIIAESGIIEARTISLKPGKNNGKPNSSPDPGFLLIRDYNGSFYHIRNQTSSFPNSIFTWQQDAASSATERCIRNPKVLVSSSASDQLEARIEDIKARMTCLKVNNTASRDGSIFADSVSELVTDFNHLLNNQSLTSTHAAMCVDVLRDVRDVNLLVIQNTQNNTGMITEVVQVVDHLLNPRNHDALKTTKLMPMILDIMDNIILDVGNVTTPSKSDYPIVFDWSGSQIVLQILKYRHEDFNGVTLPLATNTKPTVNTQQRDFMRLTSGLVNANQGDVLVTLQVYKNVDGLFPGFVDNDTTFNQDVDSLSDVMSLSIVVDGERISQLSKDVQLYFVLLSQVGKDQSLCVYWNKTLNSWQTDGLSFESKTNTHVQCSTNHLTGFAVLFGSKKMSEKHVFALDILTYICSGLSIVALFITVLIFYFIEALSAERHRIHMHLALSLLLSQTVFLAGIDATKYQILCRCIAGFLHYLFLTSFAWMCNEGIHLYLKIVKVYGSEVMKMRYYYALGWGLPAIFVGIAASTNYKGYGTDRACWLSLKDDFIWAFTGPVVAFVMINIVILVMVVKIVVSSEPGKVDFERTKIIAGIKGVAVLLPLLGVTWVFGLLMIIEGSPIAFKYIFTVTSTLQGFFLFVFHCVANNEVRSAVRRYREKNFEVNSLFSPSANGESVSSIKKKKSNSLLLQSKSGSSSILVVFGYSILETFYQAKNNFASEWP